MATAPSQGQGWSHRKVHLEHVGGDIFSASHESSNREMLWSELFKEKERAVMRKHLISRVLCFSIRDTYQISVRMLWTKEAQQHLDGQGGHENFPTPVAVLLHDFSGKLKASWVWAKLVYPLYKANISVILVDLPGFGMSRVNGNSDVALSTWIDRDWRIVLDMMDALHVRKCHFITCGESCNTALKIMKEAKLRLELTHIFFNPVISLDEVFPLRTNSGGQEAVQAAKREQQHEFEMFMHNAATKIWAMFDQSNPLTLDSNRMLCDFVALPHAGGQVVVTQLGEQHVCSASAGSTVGVPILFPCKWLRHSFVRFLKCDPTFKQPASLLAEYADGDQSDMSHSFSGTSSERSQKTGGSLSPASSKGDHASTAMAGGFNMGACPEKFSRRGLQALSRNSSDSRLTVQALSRNYSDKGSATQTLSRNCSESRVEKASSCTSTHTAFGGGLTKGEQFFRLRPRPSAAQICKATSLACQIKHADVQKEREGFLVNTRAVTKLKNLSELRGGDNDWSPGVSAREAEWIEDALDLSMHTIESDKERRIMKKLSLEERCKAAQLMRLNGEGKKKQTADSKLLDRDSSRPLEPLGTACGRAAKSSTKRTATSKGTWNSELP